jgi:DNA-binding transcriptional MerR regulator
VTTYRIAEVARRSGYSAPTLRYYETLGLLPAPARSGNGYRTYDDATLERLQFITRAKQLGCSLEEITQLAEVWEGGQCAPLQHRLQGLVETKLGDARARIGELTALVADLQQARGALEAHAPEGPCDDGCGCTTVPPAEVARPERTLEWAPTPAVLARAPGAGGEPRITCSLEAGEMAGRYEEWQRLLRRVQQREAVDGGVRLTFASGTPVEEIARLAAAEADCCRFYAFALTVDDRGCALEVRAPAGGQGVLQALFGPAA